MLKLDPHSLPKALEGPAGSLPVAPHDEITFKLAMLYEGEGEGPGPLAAARKFGFSKARYFQLRQAFLGGGALALQSQKRGPKTTYRRTEQVCQQVIRYRFLDPDASPAVVAQKLRQTGHPLSTRSVQRVIAEFGLQKKTLRLAPAQRLHRPSANPANLPGSSPGTGRPAQSRTGRPPTPGR